MINKHLLICYPRSGSNYFQIAWTQKTNKHIACFRASKHIKHVIDSPDIEKIAIIRNPIDSIASSLLIGIVHEDRGLSFEEMIKYSIEEYETIYDIILNRADYIIDISDFDDLDKIINYICKKDIGKINKQNITNKLDSMKKYSKTFIDHAEYSNIKEIMMLQNLETCKKLYSLAYEKRLVV